MSFVSEALPKPPDTPVINQTSGREFRRRVRSFHKSARQKESGPRLRSEAWGRIMNVSSREPANERLSSGSQSRALPPRDPRSETAFPAAHDPADPAGPSYSLAEGSPGGYRHGAPPAPSLSRRQSAAPNR